MDDLRWARRNGILRVRISRKHLSVQTPLEKGQTLQPRPPVVLAAARGSQQLGFELAATYVRDRQQPCGGIQVPPNRFQEPEFVDKRSTRCAERQGLAVLRGRRPHIQSKDCNQPL